MPNIGGPRASKRRILIGVADSIILYGAHVCMDWVKKVKQNTGSCAKKVCNQDGELLQNRVKRGGTGDSGKYTHTHVNSRADIRERGGYKSTKLLSPVLPLLLSPPLPTPLLPQSLPPLLQLLHYDYWDRSNKLYDRR